MTQPLGAILNGGQSRRFGSDKAMATMPDGRPMIAHVADRLAADCAALVVCGRPWGGLPAIADQPGPGMGPLGGLCAALAHAADIGFATVLCAPCDMPDLPSGLPALLGRPPAVADGQWLLGLWPAALAMPLRHLLQAEGAVSMRRWMTAAAARQVPLGPLANINLSEQLRPSGQQRR